jgi:thiol-disulfide isomerase/thioredoxin
MSAAGPDSPPPPPKPRRFGPHFWTGFGFGILALLGVLVVGIFLLSLWMKSYIEKTTGVGKTTGGHGATAFLSAPPFPAAPGPADYGFAVETMDGHPFDAASLKGKTVFLNYWATWCGPCRAEMPSIERLHARTRELGVVFLLVSDEKADTISAFLKKTPMSAPVFRATASRPAAYRSDGIPATFILSADGRIAFRHVGAANWDDDSTLAFLKGLPAAAP